MKDCLPLYLTIVLGVINSFAAHIQNWPTLYQVMNIPNFLMYTMLIYFLCKKGSYVATWIIFSVITLITINFIAISNKVFTLEKNMVNKILNSK
jgi:hypothetical protein